MTEGHVLAILDNIGLSGLFIDFMLDLEVEEAIELRRSIAVAASIEDLERLSSLDELGKDSALNPHHRRRDD